MIYLKTDNIPLKYAINDKLVEEKNGRFDLEFEYPLVDEVYKKFKKFDLLKAKTPRLGYQDFYITDIQKTNKGVKIYAKHIFFLTSKIFIKTLNFKQKSGSYVFNNLQSFVTDKNDFVFNSDISDIHSINMENTTLYDALLNTDSSILRLWKGTYVRDNYNISLKNRRGVDTEYIIAKRKNISDLNIKEDADFVVTRCYLRAKKRQTDKEKEENKPEEWLETEVESPLINKYPYVFSQYREYSDSFWSLDALRKYGEELFSVYHIDLPKESFTLKCTDEINSYLLDINDTVLIYYEDYKIHKKIEVTAYIYSPMQSRYLELTFGYRGKSLADTLTLDVNKKIDKEAKRVNQLEDDLNKSISNATFSIEKKISDKEKEVIEKFDLKLAELMSNVSKFVDGELKKINLELDEEKIKALSNAETEKYIRSKKGQQELIQAITADVVWLKAVVTETEVLNTIVANMDLAKIKKLIVDTAFIQSILSKEEFRQEFEDGGATVTNIFSKMKDTILQSVNSVISNENEKTKRELTSLINQQPSEILIAVENKLTDSTSGISKKITGMIDNKGEEITLKVGEKIENIKIGGVNLAKNSRYLKDTSWFGYQLTQKKIETISSSDGWNGFKKITFTDFKETNDGDFNLACGYSLKSDGDFENDTEYVFSFLAKNYREYPITFFMNGFTKTDRVTLQGYQSKRIVLKATKGTKTFSQIAIATHKKGYYVEFAMAELMAEKGTIPTAWNLAPDEKVNKDEVISSINLSPEKIKIKAKNIELDGNTIATSLTSQKIRGVTIEGSTIKLGNHGFLRPIDKGLHINAPASLNANYGVGMQLHGTLDGNVPKGLFIYNDTDFSEGNTAVSSDDILLTVEGRAVFANKYDGGLTKGCPIISNFYKDSPVRGLYRISYIGLGENARQLYFNDGTDSGDFWVNVDSTSSDKRLKENIEKTQFDSLDFIKKLNFYSFDWKKNRYGHKKAHTNCGLIANELQEIDESLVYENGKEKIKYIDDFRVLNIALKAIQELNEKVDKLVVENKELKEKLGGSYE